MKTAPPKMTMTIAAVTVAGYALLALMGKLAPAAEVGGFIPAHVFGPRMPGELPIWLTPLSATLLHAGAMHIGFNMLMLIYCGREDEVALGPPGIVVLYVVGAYAAAAAQYIAGPHSPVPMIGASGAISALVGAYAMLYGQRRPSKYPPAVARWLHIAWLALAWIAVQLMLGAVSRIQAMPIAAAAHIGGFIAGLILARPMLAWRYRKA